MTLDELAGGIADLMALSRCGCAVYMDGKHLPTPRERRDAYELVMAFAESHAELDLV